MIEIRNLSKTYDKKLLWEHVNLTLDPEGCYVLTGPSGCGKTTFLRCLAGLTLPDQGEILEIPKKLVRMVFQEDRLCLQLTAVENLRIAAVPDPESILTEILPEECLHQPVRELSGGMKRRVAVARAVAAPGEILLMDEPFTGLDENTREEVIAFIKKHRSGRLLVAASHDKRDLQRMDADELRWDGFTIGKIIK